MTIFRVTLLTLLSVVGCGRDDDKVITPPKTDALAPRTPDRLPPGELLEGKERVFGFPIPRNMELEAKFDDEAHIVGRVNHAQVTDYVRQRVLVQHVQVEGTRYVFPRARIKGAGPELYRIEVRPQGTKTKIYIEWLPPPRPKEDISDAERWKRAGMRPDGSLIDPQNLE